MKSLRMAFLPGTFLLATVLAPAQPITLQVDATTISRKLLSARESFPITSQVAHTVDLVYPKWIPGNHSPTGPIADLVDLHFSVEGKPVTWARETTDMYRFHVAVPAGSASLVAEFKLVGEYATGNDFAPGNTSTPVQGDVNWDQVVLYPADTNADNVMVAASIKLPERWSYATALPNPSVHDGSIGFDPVSLATLVDSPLMCGSIMKEFDITPKGISQPHYLDLFEESGEGLNVTPERINAFRNLVSEANAMFHSHHYASYHFLVEAQAESSDGLEHHQSSDEQMPTLGMVSPSFSAEAGNLLAHEYIHSWNGKFRRPAGLATPDYQQPMVGDLLWVYEGLTSYWAEVLATRAGLETEEQMKDRMAVYQAEMDARSGRGWRSLADDARSAQMLYGAGEQWANLRRSTDFYEEGPLLWLQVDSVMRERSQGKRSLDTFAAEFYSSPSGAITVKPYSYDDLVSALNHVVANDWDGLLRNDIQATRPAPVSPGLAAAGWTVTYNDEPNQAMEDTEAVSGQLDLSTSIGLVVNSDGTVADLVSQSPAANAGLSPSIKLMGVNNRVYSGELLRQAIVNAESNGQTIKLLCLFNSFYAEYSVNYDRGLRYPHLSRVGGKADLLKAIMEPRRSQ